MTPNYGESVERPRKRRRNGDANQKSDRNRYSKFDWNEKWRVFVLPASKLTVQEAKARNCHALSVKFKMSEPEVFERENWFNDRMNFQRDNRPVDIRTVEQFLENRVLAPNLTASQKSVSRPSSSNDSRCRIYPPEHALREWDEFDKKISEFHPDETKNAQYVDPWHYSAMSDRPRKDEEGEKSWFDDNVLNRLHKAKLLCSEGPSEIEKGKPDLSLFSSSNDSPRITATIEVKSTHNLWLPPSAKDIVLNYNEANNGDYHLNCCVSHVIGQVCRAMIVNEVSHGAITSSTRTHFVRFQVSRRKAFLLISRRWYVGELNYLRAWAYFAHSAIKESRKLFPKAALKNWSKLSPSRKLKRSSSRLADQRNNPALVNVVRIDWEDIEFTSVVVGNGRHGPVYEAHWGNKAVAIKIFDMDHGAEEAFEREISAYVKLENVQGLLIPKLFFWTNHWTGSLFALGLQLGRAEAVSTRYDIWAEKEEVLEKLHVLGYSHTDSADLRNFIYIDDGRDGDRLVAIDLESIEPLSSHAISEDDESQRNLSL